ncbi:MAG: T9SS type A sorting domain-containing protein [Ignavibacteria bacterium]|nr:T9SS type A sorting domain-containing protein [Ignavibacteria bacterium]
MKIFIKYYLVLSMILFLGISIVNAQWLQTNFYGVVNCFAVKGEKIFVGSQNGFVYISTNNGINWNLTSNGMSPINALLFKDTILFAGTNNGVYYSSDYGISWLLISTLTPVTSLAANGINLFAGSADGVYHSSNNGLNFTQAGLTGYPINELAVKDTYLYAAAYNNGIFRSNNNGLSWAAINAGLSTTNIGSFAVCNTNIYAGNYGSGAFLSTNGTSWITINSGLTNLNVACFAVSGTHIFSGTGNGGVFIIPNGTTNWNEVNLGLTIMKITALIVNETYLFAATYDNGAGGIWRRPLSEMITSIQSLSTTIPSDFYLEQNYPNPFNPVTKLEFEISDLGFVSLKVYGALGKEVVTLVNEKLSPGKYQVEFDGSGLTSGVYFYRLTAGEFTDTKRMILIK